MIPNYNDSLRSKIDILVLKVIICAIELILRPGMSLMGLSEGKSLEIGVVSQNRLKQVINLGVNSKKPVLGS